MYTIVNEKQIYNKATNDNHYVMNTILFSQN